MGHCIHLVSGGEIVRKPSPVESVHHHHLADQFPGFDKKNRSVSLCRVGMRGECRGGSLHEGTVLQCDPPPRMR